MATCTYTGGMTGCTEEDLRVLVAMERSLRHECHVNGLSSSSPNMLQAVLEHLLSRPVGGDGGYDVFSAYKMLGLWSEQNKQLRYVLCSDIQEMPRAVLSEDPEISLLAKWRLSVGK